MNSWDCFDTLIARRFYHPKTVFDEVGRRLDDPEFKAKRVAAEKASNKTYADIYKRLPGIDPQIELDVELEHHFPIMENMLKVKDGDLILSDMYLPKEFIERLLRKCGLDKQVDIIVTPNGKKKGWIWSEVKSKYIIETHYGDNKKSDVASAQAHGINGVYTGAFDFNEIERIVYKQDKHLACWMRYLRLVCPYTNEDDIKLYNDQADINLPVLALATLELPDTPIAFSYRDCHIWHALYEALTGKSGYRLDVSRKMWLEPNQYFDEYIKFVKENNITIVDLQGRGQSILSYYKGNPPPTIYLGGKVPPYIKKLTTFKSKSYEKHNCYELGPVIDWDENGPIRGRNDHPLHIAKIHSMAKDIAISSVKQFNIVPNKEILEYLVRLYVKDNFTNQSIEWSKYN
jgi:FMN phosphatase YigB (HAD superfamily)